MPVLFHTAIASELLADAAFHVGARGYLLKAGRLPGFLTGIERVRGGVALDPLLVGSSHPPPRTPTPRERMLARLVIAGETNERIAEGLSIAVRTVEGLLTRTFASLGVASRAEFAVRADRARWNLLPGA